MRAEQHTDAAPNDRLAFLTEVPRKTDARPEIVPVGVIRFLRIAERAKVHLSQVGWRFEIHDFRGSVRRGPNADRRIVVVPQAKVEHEPLVDSPVVLNESAEFIEMPIVRRLAVLQRHRVRDVREEIVQVLKRNVGILRICLASALARPSDTDLYVMYTNDTTELLLGAERPALQFQYFGTHGSKQASDGKQRNAPANFCLFGFRRLRRIGNKPEILETVQEAAIPSEPALGNPGATRQDVLRRDAILRVLEFLVVRDVYRRHFRVWSHPRIGHG